ncbi:MAG TPA: hypothetical protein VMM13_20135 [Euzebya sp.]|nr:hypothetical protein [Euzebya sp.]
MTSSYAHRPLPGRPGVPTTEHPEVPASRTGLLAEARGVLQLPRLLARSPRLTRMPRGDGAPVVDIPGWRTSEVSLAPLRAYLRWLGHDAHPWGLGVNIGEVETSAARLVPTVRERARSAGRPVALIGWSLGGVVARETARVLGAGVVAQVITLGSPIIGGPAFTAVAPRMSPQQRQRWVDRIEANERERPLDVPVTSIFTRRDAVVPWQASLDHHSADVAHIEVGSTHLSLGVDPDVWEIIARRLGGHR